MQAKVPSLLFLAAAAAVSLGACGGDSGTDPGDDDDGGDSGSSTTVATVDVSPSPFTFTSINETRQFSATPRNADGGTVSATVTWGTSDPTVATVSATGLVTAKDNGSATITATASGKSGSGSVQVQQAPAQLVMATQPGGGFAGAPLDVQPVVHVLDAFGTLVSIDNGTSVTVALQNNPTGAILSGTTQRTASAGTVTYTDLTLSLAGTGFSLAFDAGSVAPVTSAVFDVLAAVVSVEVTPGTLDLASLGEEQQLSAVARDENGDVITGATFIWQSGNEAVAKVSETGVVQAVANGTVEITARAGGVESPPATVTVQQVPASLEVSPSLAVLAPSGNRSVSVTVFDARGNVIDNPPTIAATSRNTGAVTASGTQLTGVAAGSGYVVFASGAASDSGLVAVAEADGFATVVSSAANAARVSTASGEAFTARLYFLRPPAGGGTLGSLQGRLEWNAAHLSLVSSAAGAAGFSWVPNDEDAGTGVLRFSAYDAEGDTSGEAVIEIAVLEFGVVGGAGGSSLFDLVIDVAGSAPGATITSLVQVLDAAIRIAN